MGRVFDALRKSSSTEKSTLKKYNHRVPQRRDGSPENHGLPSASQIEEQLFSGSSIMSARHETARKFSVLCTLRMYPTGRHSPAELLRVMLGQLWTLPGAARAGGFVSYDISPARVEPHLVAVSQPSFPLLRAVSITAHQNSPGRRALTAARFCCHQCGRRGR